MKLTNKQLRTIITEEIRRFNGVNEDVTGGVPSGAYMSLVKLIHDAVEACDELTSEPGGKRYAECQKHLLAAAKAAKGGPRI